MLRRRRGERTTPNNYPVDKQQIWCDTFAVKQRIALGTTEIQLMFMSKIACGELGIDAPSTPEEEEEVLRLVKKWLAETESAVEENTSNQQ